MPRQPGILGGMPAVVQRQIADEQLNRASMIGNMTPGGHAAWAGGGLGRAAMGLMGQAEDPRLKQAQTLQSIEQEIGAMGLEPGTPEFTQTLGQLLMTRLGPGAAAKGVSMARELEKQKIDVDALRGGPAAQEQKMLNYSRVLNRMGYSEQDSYLLAQNEEIAQTAIKEKLKPEKLASAIEIYERAKTDKGFNDWYMAQKKAGGVSVSQTNVAGYKVPSGFMPADPADPSKGVVPIPGGPSASQTPEAAAKTAMLEQARSSVARFKELIAPDGIVDRTNIAAMSFSVPGTSGRQARVLILDAIEAKLRAESGAAVPPQEVERAAERFMPSTLDNDALVLDKMRRLDDFLKSAVGKIDPTGSFTNQPGEKPVEQMTDEELMELAK